MVLAHCFEVAAGQIRKDTIGAQQQQLEETIKEQGERETREKSEKDAKKKEGKRTTVVDKDGEKVLVR